MTACVGRTSPRLQRFFQDCWSRPTVTLLGRLHHYSRDTDPRTFFNRSVISSTHTTQPLPNLRVVVGKTETRDLTLFPPVLAQGFLTLGSLETMTRGSPGPVPSKSSFPLPVRGDGGGGCNSEVDGESGRGEGDGEEKKEDTRNLSAGVVSNTRCTLFSLFLFVYPRDQSRTSSPSGCQVLHVPVPSLSEGLPRHLFRCLPGGNRNRVGDR